MTKTYFQRDTDLATGIHVDTHEDRLDAAAGTGQTESISLAGGDIGHLVFTTPAGEPNSADWPNGTYRAQLDCTVAGADIGYGLLVGSFPNGTRDGHWARVDSGLTAHQGTVWRQSEVAFTGTGLKLATQTQDPAAGADADRLEVRVGAGRAASLNSQTLTLRYSSDAFVDGPWVAAAADRPQPTKVLSQAAQHAANL